jgi:hypothetical protein
MSDQGTPPGDPHYEYQKMQYEAYKVARSEAEKFALEIGGRYERMLTLIAGGALIVSVTFIEKLAPSPVPWSKWIALLAWALLAGSILSSLVAIAASQQGQQRKIENMDLEINQRLYPDNEEYKGKDATSNPYVAKVVKANASSLYAAILGLICLVLFVFVNFPAAKKHEQQEPAKSEACIKGTCRDTVVCPNKESGCPASAALNPAVETKTGEITMPPKPPLQPPQPSPTQPARPLTESYVPTKSPVAPPPPPSPPKDGK